VLSAFIGWGRGGAGHRGEPSSIALTSASLACCAGSSRTSRAPRLSSSWARLRAPTIGAVTAGLSSVRASATREGVVPVPGQGRVLQRHPRRGERRAPGPGRRSRRQWRTAGQAAVGYGPSPEAGCPAAG